jgi:site-specific recombinase XerD
MGIRTGFRISELLSLRLQDAMQGEEIAQEITVARAHMKKKVEGRTVPLHPEAREALSAFVASIDSPKPESPLFRSQKGGPLKRNTAWLMLTNACKKAGIFGRLGTHCMRKSFAHKMYEIFGHDLLKTQEAMGHKSLTSTAAYLQVNQKEIREAILKS